MLVSNVNPAEDVAFDAVYPATIRLLSPRFWTPVAVARRAATLLRAAGARRVLDVGAGVGKFVLVAAGEAAGLEFVGVEQRAHLVEMARKASHKPRIPNAHFHAADATTISWGGFDAFYFFNPFAENLYFEDDRIDDHVELTKKRFVRDAIGVERALRAAPVGSLALTYHGLSGRIPACYELEASEPAGSDWLRLWAKRREKDDGHFFVEVDDGTVLLQ
jgi:SAM-dependent methyltransferase